MSKLVETKSGSLYFVSGHNVYRVHSEHTNQPLDGVTYSDLEVGSHFRIWVDSETDNTANAYDTSPIVAITESDAIIIPKGGGAC